MHVTVVHVAWGCPLGDTESPLCRCRSIAQPTLSCAVLLLPGQRNVVPIEILIFP